MTALVAIGEIMPTMAEKKPLYRFPIVLEFEDPGFTVPQRVNSFDTDSLQ